MSTNNVFYQEFLEFIKALNENEVEYLIIGGFAVGFHRYSRATGDIDFWINKTKDNAIKVVKACIDFGIAEEDLFPEMFLSDEKLVKIGEAPYKIEILNVMSGLK